MKELVFSGFGGQGVLTAGLILADVALMQDMYATWIPSYGAEMRGGKANCVVKIDKEQVGTPTLESADLLVAMNIPSLEFVKDVKPGGTVIVDADFVPDEPQYRTREDVTYYRLSFSALARSADNPKGANVVAVGVVTALMDDVFDRQQARDGMVAYFEEKGKDKFRAANERAFDEGYAFMKQLLAGE